MSYQILKLAEPLTRKTIETETGTTLVSDGTALVFVINIDNAIHFNVNISPDYSFRCVYIESSDVTSGTLINSKITDDISDMLDLISDYYTNKVEPTIGDYCIKPEQVGKLNSLYARDLYRVEAIDTDTAKLVSNVGVCEHPKADLLKVTLHAATANQDIIEIDHI